MFSIGLLSDITNFPALTNFTKDPKSDNEMSINEYMILRLKDPRDSLKVYHNDSEVQLKIMENNKNEKYVKKKILNEDDDE